MDSSAAERTRKNIPWPRASSVKLEWQPLKHFLLVLGGTFQYLSTEGTIRSGSVKLDQTLYGPIIGFGDPVLGARGLQPTSIKAAGVLRFPGRHDDRGGGA